MLTQNPKVSSITTLDGSCPHWLLNLLQAKIPAKNDTKIKKTCKKWKDLKSNPLFSKIKLMIKPPNAPKVPGAIGAYPRPKKVAMILLNFRTITFLRRDL